MPMHHRRQRQQEILNADDFVVHAENIFPDEAAGLCHRTMRTDPPAWACELMRGLLEIGSGFTGWFVERIMFLISLARCLLLEESVVVGVGHDVQVTVHARVAQPAELRADDFVLADFIRR